MQNIKKLKFLFFFSILLLNSCATVPQVDYRQQADNDLQMISSQSQITAGEEITILGNLIHSEKLESLVSEALEANPSLQQTLLTLRIQQAEYRQTSGAKYPQLEAGFSAGKDEDNDASYTGSLTISWEVDLWRKLNDSSKAAAKDVAEQQALYQSACDSLTAEVMKDWLNLITAEKNIAIEEKRITTLNKNQDFILNRYRNGLGTLADLESSRTSVASARAVLESYRENLAQQLRSMQNLLGRLNAKDISIPDDYPAVLLPLAGIPLQSLQRRPDLKAAYLAIEAASLQASAAYKDLLPSISLQAAFEDIATSPSAALLNDPLWSLLAQLTAPLYQGGQLKAAAEIAELETAQSYQIYRETLLEAVQDVDDTLSLERSLPRRQQHVETALQAARNNLQQYESNYRNGLVEIPDLLSVQLNTYDLEIQHNELVYEHLANRIDLGLALGLGVTP